MVPEACWAMNRLAVLLSWHSRLATIVSPREFGPVLTNYCTHHRTSNFPTDSASCRVSVFGPSPLQWIYKELVQKLGSNKATACFGIEKYTEPDGPTSQGERAPRPRTGTPNSPRIPEASLLSLGLLASFPLWVIFVVIYPSLLFILLLHLSVIHAHTRVHVPSATLSGALWAVVAPTALSRGHIHINGIRVLTVSI